MKRRTYQLHDEGGKDMGKSILIVGITHFFRPDNGDLVHHHLTDVSSQERQVEMQSVVKALQDFHPTKVALELNTTKQKTVNLDYKQYLCDKFELSVDETHQLGFRLAKLCGLEDVHCIDWNEAQPHVPSFFQWADNHKPPMWLELEQQIEERAMLFEKALSVKSVRDIILMINSAEYTSQDHSEYVKMALLSDEAQNVGALWVVQYWYYRNMLLFKHLCELFKSDDDRVLFFVGAGHVHLLTQFLREHGDFEVESVKTYLG